MIGKKPVILTYSKDENFPTDTWVEYDDEFNKLSYGTFVDFAHRWRKDPTTAVVTTEGLKEDGDTPAKELWVINKKMFPAFLDVGIVSENPKKYVNKHLEFVLGLQRFYPKFSFPYLAFLEKEMAFPVSGDQYYLIREPNMYYYYTGRVSHLTENSMGLYWVIEKATEGFFPDWNRKEYVPADIKTPVTGVVEFSESELYPEVMKKLGKKYKINRLVITRPAWER